MSTTVSGGTTATFGMDAFASLTVTLSAKDSAGTITFTSAAPSSDRPSFDAKLQAKTFGPFLVPMTVSIAVTDGSCTYDLAGGTGGFSYDADDAVNGFVGPDSEIIALSEVSPYVNLTATGTAFTGACEFAGYICTVAAGNITVYDNTSAAGTVIVPTTALVVGSYPIFGAGTNGKMALATGCHVVLSGAATVNVLVG